MFNQVLRLITATAATALIYGHPQAQDGQTPFDPYDAYQEAQASDTLPPAPLPLTPDAEPDLDPSPENGEKADDKAPPEDDPYEGAILPFYLSAEEYLNQRDDDVGPAVELVYEISADSAAPMTTTLIISSDYAAETRQGPAGETRTVIYDFKHNRIVTVLPGAEADSAPSFVNAPLFAKVHTTIQMVRANTKNGETDSIKLPGGTSLDAFWLESSAGWALEPRDTDLSIERDGDTLTALYKDAPALELSFSDTPYSDMLLSNTFLLYANHTLPIHPTISKELYSAKTAPAAMTLYARSPQSPKGSAQTWTLISQTAYTDGLPLPREASSVLQQPDIDPLAYIIRQAADGDAQDGKPEKARMAQTALSLIKDGALTEGWLYGQRFTSHWGACPQSEENLCRALSELEDQSDLSTELNGLIAAFAHAQEPASRVRAVKALLPWMKDQDAPATVLRTLAMSRAKIQSGTARAAMIDTIDVEGVLLEALAKDPYDPLTHLGLAQYYAANNKLGVAWDIYDALRVASAGVNDQSFAIDEVESQLKMQAPGFFLPEP